ncbi:MAG: site-2 protease family protein [Desulfobacteraceae bacterium]|nr:site-2 protease family protein [Desulfobacteraceae bacterium]
MDIRQVTPILAYGVFMSNAILHEVAHAYAAYKFGDDSAKKQGRLTVNPINHLDAVGSVVMPLAMLILTSNVFGWAKPVPVDFDKMTGRQQFIISGAGLVVNIVLALLVS